MNEMRLPGLRSVQIEDRYSLSNDAVMLSGTQALLRLLLEQRALDARAGLNTAGFVSGYRGSPLGGLDFALWRAQRELEQSAIRFEPGLNEELAANAVWGSQQIEHFARPHHQGVFGLWYGKNPGLDRVADVLKHANMEGTAALGGVLAVSGDDPAASSSSIANQGEPAFTAAMSPVLYPGSIEDVIYLGLAGFALSRFSGLWVGFKLVADTVESSASLLVPRVGSPFVIPADFELPPGGLNQRRPDTRWAQEERMQRFKLPSVRAFARANSLDRTLVAPGQKRIGFIAAGKAFRDLAEAFAILGLTTAEMARLGIGLRKLALVWPIEDLANGDFLRGFGEIVVVEEKRGVVEPQLKELAYHWPADMRPRIFGKRDAEGKPLVSEHGETNPVALACVLLDRLAANAVLPSDRTAALRERLRSMAAPVASNASAPVRIPHFCAGCPHGRSTRLPEGSQALAGIGCHSMIAWTPNSTTAFIPQMGGEGANWIGTAPFVDTPHVFQNLGDGTYFHSGVLAVRAAVAAKLPITYKVLVNAAVAMTGGQPIEGAPDAARIAWQLHAEGVGRIAVLTGPGGGFAGTERDLPPGAWLRDRDDLDEVMRALREFRGVSAIVYDQICATEKRRLRKRGKAFADEPVIVINDRACEGCGDCSVKSRCIGVRQIETPFGAKRFIDQSACNTDLSCLDGFCPSFITLEGAVPQEAATVPLPAQLLARLPEPARAAIPGERPYGIVVAGVGGSGLITVGALLGMAAHLEGLPVTVLDSTGLARKGGEVTTDVRVGGHARETIATRLPGGSADLLLAGDLACAATGTILAKAAPGAQAVVLDEAVPMLHQAIDPDQPLPTAAYRERVEARLGQGSVRLIDAAQIARQALGDAIFTNMVLLGAAVQAGLIPVGRNAVEQAVRLNGVAVDRNLTAFAWGRLAVVEPALVARMADPPSEEASSGEAQISFFADELGRYQNARTADRYRGLVERVAAADRRVGGAAEELTSAVVKNAFKALAVKDEYEVARLISDRGFHADLRRRFGANVRPTFHIAPPFVPLQMTRDGRRAKRAFGPWMLPVLRLLAGLRFLRGGPFDLFGWQAERKAERRFHEAYFEVLTLVAQRLTPDNYAEAVDLARLPERVRGYGYVKAPQLEAAMTRLGELSKKFQACGAAAAE